MPQWIALSRAEHVDKYFQPRQGYRFAANEQVVPVLIAELAKLLPYYTLGFIQQGDDIHPVALTGLGGERNLYLHPDGRWLANYVPSVLRAYPFRVAKADNGQQVLAIEQESLVDDPSAQPLFNHEGHLAKKVQQTLDFLTQCDQNRQVTTAACQALKKAGVIEPWPLQVERGEGQEPLKMQGLYRINEPALNQLDAESFANLRGHGALPLAYAQLLSQSQLNQLSERAKFHAKHGATQEVPEDLDSVFDNDDDLTFDFDS